MINDLTIFDCHVDVFDSEIVTLAVDGTVYGNVEPPFGGFSTLEEELRLEAANLWREGGTFAPFDQEVTFSFQPAQKWF